MWSGCSCSARFIGGVGLDPTRALDHFRAMGDVEYPQKSPWLTGIACRCPRCGDGRLFAKYLVVANDCSNCGLDFRNVDPGDGPAVFIIFVVGFIVVAAALWTEVTFQPPYWLHLTMWLPAVLVGSLGLLPPFKAILIGLEFKHKARESRRAN